MVFCDFWVKPAASEPLSLEDGQFVDAEGSVSGFFKIDAKGYLYFLDGEGGEKSDGEGEGDEKGGGEWKVVQQSHPDQKRCSIGVREDHTSSGLRGAKSWDVYIDGKLELANLGLWDKSAENLRRFSLMGHTVLPLVIDDLTIDSENMLFVDARYGWGSRCVGEKGVGRRRRRLESR